MLARPPMAGLEPAWARGPSHPFGGIGSIGLFPILAFLTISATRKRYHELQ